MFTKCDLKKTIEEHDPNTMWFRYDIEREMLINKDTGKDIGSLDAYLQVLREDSGQSFENIYDEHVTCSWVIRCTKCGCVLFGGDDERYEPSLKCPVCTDYIPSSTTFWTKEDIDKDIKKQNTIKMYQDMQRQQTEYYKRIQSRNGKYDWQIWDKEIKLKNRVIKFELECDNITKSYLKGLRFKTTFSKSVSKDENGNIFSWTHGKIFTIPLSWSCFYRHFIYIHLGKCHREIRSKWYIGKPVN